MGLVFHLICLFFTLFVLQSYVSSGFHAREHRLLPLVLGLIALNSFYRITYYVTGEAQTLRILTDLLAIHMLYLMIHYVGDFMKFQLKLRTEVILFCSLVLFNSMLIIRAAQRETYQDAFRIALLCYTGILLLCDVEQSKNISSHHIFTADRMQLTPAITFFPLNHIILIRVFTPTHHFGIKRVLLRIVRQFPHNFRKPSSGTGIGIPVTHSVVKQKRRDITDIIKVFPDNVRHIG